MSDYDEVESIIGGVLVLILAVVIGGFLFSMLVSSNEIRLAPNTPTQSVNTYLAALEAQQLPKMQSSSCAAWESGARRDYDSFKAVKVQLNNVACTEGSRTGTISRVQCTGQIVTTYNAETSSINLALQTYKVELERGEWRVCGYVE